MNVIDNIDVARQRFIEMTVQVDKGLQIGLSHVAHKAINRRQINNLRGAASAAPGSYRPVPNRTGHLMRGAMAKMIGRHMAIVGNTSAYAGAVHNGMYDVVRVQAHERRVAKVFGRDIGRMAIQKVPEHWRKMDLKERPFLKDAADDTDINAIITRAIDKAVGQ